MNASPDLTESVFLFISGQIAATKKKEFEQTYRLIADTITRDCLLYNLSMDVSREGQYQFVSLWSDESALMRFMKSEDYQMMNGAFHALGSVEKLLTGNITGTRDLIIVSNEN